jgi:GTP cyclohydrolase I
MNTMQDPAAHLPDVARAAPSRQGGTLAWVGMSGIDLPLALPGDGTRQRAGNARVAAFVDLARADVRGIHMSRLYRELGQSLAAAPLAPPMLEQVLREFVASHREISQRALLKLRFDLLLLRPALLSDNAGWKRYPVALQAAFDAQQFTLELGLAVLYSSTCPSSAALARQSTAERFAREFAHDAAPDRERVGEWLASERGMAATPHAQRSRAEVRIRIALPQREFAFVALIDAIENALATPVQTAVKREDEREFARLNADNLMFCEDAARRVQSALDRIEFAHDYWLATSHFESLHPHDAVAVAVKGVAGGYDGLRGGLLEGL